MNFSWFLKRSYPGHLTDAKMKRVKFTSRKKTEKIKFKWVPTVVTYHPSLNCLHKIIKGNTCLLNMNEKLKNVFLDVLRNVFLAGLISYFLMAKSYPLHRKVEKQPSKRVRKKRYSENMRQVYRRTPMPKCDCFATLLKSHFGMGDLL